jgi:outer membrane protein assembly complex protein YaeT
MPRSRAFLTAALLFLAALVADGCKEEGDIRVASLKFEGVSQVSKSALANALRTKQGSRLFWGRKRYFDRRAFEEDLKRIEVFYHDRGFPDARVASVDVTPNDKQDAVAVTVRITEGEPIVVAEITYEGFDVLPQREQRRLRRQLPLKEAMPLDRQLASASRERAANALHDHGFPYAEVRLTNEPVGTRKERVVLRAEPGILAHFGPIAVSGAESVGENVVRRELTFDSGDEYSLAKMKDAQRSLYSMELFQFVNVDALEDKAQQTSEVPVRVTVAEGKHRKLTFGLGYGSEEKVRARVRWDHVNFFGGARHLGLEARWSSLDRGVRAELREPFFFYPKLSLNFEGQWWDAAEPVYSQNTVGGRVIVRHQLSRQQFWSASFINEFQKSTIEQEALDDPSLRDDFIALGLDPRTGATEGTVTAFALDFNRNTTNNIIDARRGYLISGHVEKAGAWMWGSYSYLSTTVEGRYFFTISRRFVVANRSVWAAIDPTENLDANVPFGERFFAGGANSNRGWGRYEVSPLDVAGFPIGGLTMLDGSSELRFPIFGKFSGVTFVDYGNVWEEGWKFDLTDLRYSIGSGLRYQTPIGPARIDIGYQLNPIDGLLVGGEEQQRQWRVHFSIGQAF